MWMMLCAALVHSWVWRTMLGSTPGRVRNYFPASCRTRTPWHRCILWLWAPCSSGISNDASGFLRVIGRDSDDAGVLDDARFHAPPGFGERCLVQPQAERAANSVKLWTTIPIARLDSLTPSSGDHRGLANDAQHVRRPSAQRVWWGVRPRPSEQRFPNELLDAIPTAWLHSPTSSSMQWRGLANDAWVKPQPRA